MLKLSDSSASRLTFREFRDHMWQNRKEIEIACRSVEQAYRASGHTNWSILEQYDSVMLSVQALREAIYQFSSLLHMTAILPWSVWSTRYPLIRILCSVSKQVNDLILQIHVFRNLSQKPSRCIKMQQQRIQRDLEVLLEEGRDAVTQISIFIDQVSFIERPWFS